MKRWAPTRMCLSRCNASTRRERAVMPRTLACGLRSAYRLRLRAATAACRLRSSRACRTRARCAPASRWLGRSTLPAACARRETQHMPMPRPRWQVWKERDCWWPARWRGSILCCAVRTSGCASCRPSPRRSAKRLRAWPAACARARPAPSTWTARAPRPTPWTRKCLRCERSLASRRRGSPCYWVATPRCASSRTRRRMHGRGRARSPRDSPANY